MVSLLYRHLYDHEPEKLTYSGPSPASKGSNTLEFLTLSYAPLQEERRIFLQRTVKRRAIFRT